MTDNNSHTASSSSFPPSDLPAEALAKEGWVETTLGEVAEIMTDYVANGSFASIKENVKYQSNKDFARVLRLTDFNSGYSLNNAVYVNEKSYNFLKKSKIFPGDIVVSNVGEYSGTVFRAKDIGLPQTLGPNSILVRFGKSDNFMYYFLSSKVGQSLINSIKAGSASPKFNKTDFKTLAFLLPPFPEQQAIASVLSAFDDKIELLREQNKTLEAMGQVIFREWFGKYGVDDELPEGWRVGKLGEVCGLKSGFAFSGDDFVEKSNTMVLKIKDLKGNGVVNLSDISFVKDEVKNLERVQYFKLKVGDIVLAMSGNTTGKIGIIPNFEEELFLNQRVGKFFIDDEKYKTFIYFFLMSGKYEEKILAMGYGSAQPNINPTQIGNIDIIFPDNKTLENFINATNPIFTKILDNLHQIQSLARSRDELLPKLMSGMLRVNDFSNN